MAFISPVNQMTTADALHLASLAAYGNNKALQDLLVAMISGNVAVLPGSSTAGGGVTVRSGGNIYSNAGAAIQGNAAVTTNTVLATALIPANSFDGIQSRVLSFFAAGKFAATGNNKVIRIYFGSDFQTVGQPVVSTASAIIADSGVVTTNTGGWNANAQVTKYGVPGSNTQIGVNMGIITGVSHVGTTAPVSLTGVENGPLYITVTGASSTTGAANDVVLQNIEVTWNN